MGHPRGAPGALHCPWEKDRAPQGCPFRERSRTEHPGAASRARHCHWEKDGASWGSISGTERRMGHAEAAAPELGAGQSTSGVHPASIMSLGEGQGTPGLHLCAEEKDVAPWKCAQIPSLSPREGQSIPGVHPWG